MWDGASASVGCGVQGDAYSPRLPSTKKRVINGQIAKAHSWPWIVIQEKNGNIFCGGTLIRVSDNLEESDIVLTAAHCVGVGKTEWDSLITDRLSFINDLVSYHWLTYHWSLITNFYHLSINYWNFFSDPSNYDGWTVTAGKQVRTQTESGQQKRKVIKAVYNSDYVPVKNDIALVKLESSIKFSDTIRPACFPKQGDPTPVGKQCVVAGWGRTDSNGFKEREFKFCECGNVFRWWPIYASGSTAAGCRASTRWLRLPKAVGRFFYGCWHGLRWRFGWNFWNLQCTFTSGWLVDWLDWFD